MKATIDIPDELFRQSKATAALEGRTLREFVASALRAQLGMAEGSMAGATGWRSVFGRASGAAIEEMEGLVESEFSGVDEASWL